MAGIPVLVSVFSLVRSLYGEANDVNLEGIEPKMEEKKIVRHSLTIAQAIKLSTSTHTLVLLIYPQCDIGVSINGCGNYCVVEAEIKNSTCNQ